MDSYLSSIINISKTMFGYLIFLAVIVGVVITYQKIKANKDGGKLPKMTNDEIMMFIYKYGFRNFKNQTGIEFAETELKRRGSSLAQEVTRLNKLYPKESINWVEVKSISDSINGSYESYGLGFGNSQFYSMPNSFLKNVDTDNLMFGGIVGDVSLCDDGKGHKADLPIAFFAKANTLIRVVKYLEAREVNLKKKLLSGDMALNIRLAKKTISFVISKNKIDLVIEEFAKHGVVVKKY